ncbi:PilN domain-containing protein [Planosporangium sp. 12N6]|uniref:PilN domain-containing protein n=1 Tax=Planosporangium spinosum TaxID=3402278 RepID=UPI003CEBFA96
MTTTLMPPGPAAEQAARPLAISADLLPPEIVEARRAHRVRRIVLSILVGFTALLAGWYALASYQTAVARDDLRIAQGDVQRLSRQQKDFADLVRTQAESQTVNAQLANLLTGDLRWSRLLEALREQAPAQVRLGSVAGTFTGDGAAGSAAARPLNASPDKLVGAVTITGTADSKASVAAYLDGLATVPGLANPFVDSVTQQDTRYEFIVRVDITGSFPLSGRYPTRTGDHTGGN